MILNYKKWSLILLSGIPGSWKSTFCKKYFAKKLDYVISSDEIRQRYFGIKNVFQDDGNLWESLFQWTWKEVFEIMEILVKKRCDLWLTTVIDSTNLTNKQRKSFVNLWKWTETYTIIFDENIWIENNNKRKLNNEFWYVNQDIMNNMLEKFEKRSSIKWNHLVKAEEIEDLQENFDEINIWNEKNVLIWWDIHGVKDFCNIYKDLQVKYEKTWEKPINIFVWDIVDRWEYSIENLFFIMLEVFRWNAFMILWNHEKKTLENLLIYKETWEISENIISRFTTLKRFANYFSWQDRFLNIPEVNERNFNLEMTIEFLKWLNYYKVLNFCDKKYLITHAPTLFENNLWNLLKQECLHWSYQFANDLKASKETAKINKINYLKAFEMLYNKTQTKLVCWHFDLALIGEEFNIWNGLISLEWEVDNGWFLKVLSLENKDGEVIENILKFPSNLKYIRDENVWEFYKRLKNLDEKYYNKKELWPLSIYKYSREVFYDNLWHKNDKNTNELLLKLRWIVFDVLWNVVSYPFDKIFNFWEILKDSENNIISENKVREDKNYQFVEKLNWFLWVISPHPYKKDILVHTSWSLTWDYAEYIKKFISKDKHKKLIEFFETNKLTLCFEVICAEDPHIIKYSENEFGLYLIWSRDISSKNIENMNLLSEEKLDEIAEKLWFKRPKYFISTLSEVKKDIKNLKIEWYILRDLEITNPVIKLKTPYYLITKFLSRMWNGKFELLFKNKMQFIKTKEVDEEYFPVLDYIIENKETFSQKDNLEKAEFIREFLSR